MHGKKKMGRKKNLVSEPDREEKHLMLLTGQHVSPPVLAGNRSSTNILWGPLPLPSVKFCTTQKQDTHDYAIEKKRNREQGLIN